MKLGQGQEHGGLRLGPRRASRSGYRLHGAGATSDEMALSPDVAGTRNRHQHDGWLRATNDTNH
jgi:hypothetical protein